LATVSEREKLEAEELEDRVIRIDRTRKTVKGGRLSSARVVVAVGDNRGRVGLGIGKARNVPEAIAKGIRAAKKDMIRVPLDGYTIPHVVQAKVGGAVILLRPASRGTGIIAGGAVRHLIEISGIRDVLTKSLGSGNVMNRAKACFKAFCELRDPQEVAERRGITVEEMIGRDIVDPYALAEETEEIEEEAEAVEVEQEAEEAAQAEEEEASEEVVTTAVEAQPEPEAEEAEEVGEAEAEEEAPTEAGEEAETEAEDEPESQAEEVEVADEEETEPADEDEGASEDEE